MVELVEKGKVCPACAEVVKPAAVICRFCGYDFQTGRHREMSVPLSPPELQAAILPPVQAPQTVVVQKGENSFQSCMGCVGAALVTILLVIGVSSVRSCEQSSTIAPAVLEASHATDVVDSTPPAIEIEQDAAATGPSPEGIGAEEAALPDMREYPPVKVTANWIVGAWSIDADCLGDSDETFWSDGVWTAAHATGKWKLAGRKLILTSEIRVPDRTSGLDERIDPPEVSVREIKAASANQFSYSDGDEADSMFRCRG